MISTAVLAAAVAFGPAGRAAADAGDFVAGAVIGGVVGHALTKDAQRKKAAQKRVYVPRASIPSTQEGRQIQSSLNYFGFDAGTVDGQLGRKSRDATSRYQAYMGYPVTGQLTAFEQTLLTGAYNRAQAGGYAVTQQIAASPDGTRGLLKAYRTELAGQPPAQALTATAPAQPQMALSAPAATAATTTLPNFMGGGAERSLASHCNTISLLTSSNGGFTTAATMQDANFTLNEQFCLARTYAIAQSEDMIARVPGFTPQQIEAQCDAFGPAMKDHVAALSLKSESDVVRDVTGFILSTGMSPSELTGTAKICLGVGYRTDDMDVAIGSGLLLYAVGEQVYGELMGHHLAQGFGTAKRSDMALAWYDRGLAAVDGGAVPVFAPGQPERNALIRKAALQMGGGQTDAMSTPLQPVSALPSFPVQD
jgi:hypothetical protein